MITHKLVIPTCALLMSSSFSPVAYTSISYIPYMKLNGCHSTFTLSHWLLTLCLTSTSCRTLRNHSAVSVHDGTGFFHFAVARGNELVSKHRDVGAWIASFSVVAHERGLSYIWTCPLSDWDIIDRVGGFVAEQSVWDWEEKQKETLLVLYRMIRVSFVDFVNMFSPHQWEIQIYKDLVTPSLNSLSSELLLRGNNF